MSKSVITDQLLTNIADDVRARYLNCGITNTDRMTPVQMPSKIKDVESTIVSEILNHGHSIGNDTYLLDLSWSNITSIPNYAFSGRDEWQKIFNFIFPSTISSIGVNAFAYSNVRSVILQGWTGDNMTLSATFKSCFLLQSFEIPEGPQVVLGSESFYNCSSLTTLTFPSTLIYLLLSSDGSDFTGCTSLTTIYCKAAVPPDPESYTTFLGTDILNNQGKIYVPRNSVAAYKGMNGWSSYASIIEGYDF